MPVVAAPVSPRLVVLVVVDQLPVRLFEAAKPMFTSGLARLSGAEAHTAVARHAHAVTFTCPGHATISTGAAPAVSGIVSNDWYLPGEPEGLNVYCGDPALLKVPTLADQVVAAGGQVAALGLKDRSAMMLGGTRATLVSYFDRTSTRFSGPMADIDPSAWLATEWTPLHPDRYAEIAGPDDGPLEGDPGLGTTFPHPATTDTPKLFLITPFAGSALTDVALAAVERLSLGADEVPDLLALAYSHIDYIGHTYTSESWETLDAMVRLDQDLGRLFNELDAGVGRDRYTILLTSDHGSTRPSDVRIPADAVEKAANAALKAAGFAGVTKHEDPGVWLPVAVRADPVARAKASEAVAAALRAVPGIGGAWAWRTAIDGEHAEAVRLAVDDERSGDVYVLLAPNALYDYPGSEGKGTSHGTPYDDDARVPFLAWGAGVDPGTTSGDVDVRQVAPTAAALLGVPAPSGATMPAVPNLRIPTP